MMNKNSEQRLMDKIQFNSDQLIPVIAQCAKSKEILMMAWMNKGALSETMATGRMCYWSRSRESLWRKGESSGQVQHVKELRLDCDGDTIVALVEQEGVACHTGRKNCFYLTIQKDGALTENQPVIISPDELYGSTKGD